MSLSFRLRVDHFSNSLDLSAPEEAYSRNVCASGTLKFRYEGAFKIQADRANVQILEARWTQDGETSTVFF